ncbi:MAG: TIR domain-containing protein [Candidatus Riflebacteria bacterium]|nr:TIR domain-containing protein [Candidatus Riflebacteria bacterium]
MTAGQGRPSMTQAVACPKCGSVDVRFRQNRGSWICDTCDHIWATAAEGPAGPVRARERLKIFLSYGHDKHAADAQRIKADLVARGHEVWFDLERLRSGSDWEAYIEDGLRWCDKVVLLMTPYSVRRRIRGEPRSSDGFCLNEIAKALEKNKLIIPVLLVELADGPPTSICRIQYLDLRDVVPIEQAGERYEVRFARLVRAVEDEDLDFEGGQARLARLLRPLDFSADLGAHLSHFQGRQWLLDAVDQWLSEQPTSRVFWLVGDPGVGKTAFASHLVHRRREVIAYHLCAHGHEDKGEPKRALLSLAYQMAEHLEEYKKRLCGMALEDEVSKSASTLFDNLVVSKLSGDFPPPDGPRLVLIDAIDEATKGGGNELAALVRDHWHKTPPWLRLLITSRPESEVISTLAHVPSCLLDARGSESLSDLRAYISSELASRGLPVRAGWVQGLLDRSQGMFLYVVWVLKEVAAGHLSLDRPEEFPRGLGAIYASFFARQFSDPDPAEARLRAA